jgi:hypothetical protein
MAKETEQQTQPRPQKADLNRSVRYVFEHGAERAAIIALVEDEKSGRCTLLVIKADGFELVHHPNIAAGNGANHPTALLRGVEFDPEGSDGTWHWPDFNGRWVEEKPKA